MHSDQEIKSKIKKLGENLTEYQLALYLYSFSSFLEVMLLENFNKNYINEIKEKINHLNADYVIVQEKESIPEVFKRFEEEGHPINVAMDCLAGKDMGEALSYMARGGYWVIISTLAGVTSEIQLRPILTKGLHLVGSMLRNRSNEEKEKLLKNLQRDFFKYFKDGSIKPSIYKILDIAQVEEAHNILLTNKNVGKVVLKIG